MCPIYDVLLYTDKSASFCGETKSLILLRRQIGLKAFLSNQKCFICMLQENEFLVSNSDKFELGKNFSSLLYLTNVNYFEQKHEILVEFSSNERKLVKRYRFFPFVFLPHSIEKEKLVQLILDAGFKGFSVEEDGNKLILKTILFSDLKKICNSLAIHTNKFPVVLPPERAFLLEKNWSFFDAFEEKDELLFKVDFEKDKLSKCFWDKFDLGFALTREFPFSQALKMNKEDALFLVELASWSNILCVALDKVPKSINEKTELFLENVFFKNAESISFEPTKNIFFSSGYDPLPKKDNLSKINFSSIWFDLFSNNFFNIGPETRNCSCCIPLTLESKNILPSSLIKVQFEEDNFFFESSSDSFSLKFHNKMPYKDVRLSKRKEFFLNAFPIGPFFKDDYCLVPATDAKRLISEKRVKLVSSKDSCVASQTNELCDVAKNSSQNSVHELNWFCLDKESFFSKEVRAANSKLFLLHSAFSFFEVGLFSNSIFGYLFAQSLHKSLHSVLLELPNQLTNSSSKFYSTSLAQSIISIQEATISKFKEFSVEKGYRVLHANKNSAFVKGFSSLKLAKSFALQNNLPQPEIAGFAGKTKPTFA